MIFQRQKALLWSKGLKKSFDAFRSHTAQTMKAKILAGSYMSVLLKLLNKLRKSFFVFWTICDVVMDVIT